MLQTITGLTTKTRHTPPQLFGLDLNCAIYHCVHKLQKKNPYNPAFRSKWEQDLITSVVAYIKQIDAIVQPTETLYIGVDGVVAMAKIRQQRMRRFKSSVAAEEEGRIKAEALGKPYTPIPRWDTNAITPGTQFMANLATALKTYAKTNPKKIVVSAADEPGEGEQKIMAYIRKHKPKDSVIYGLDADLIVLSLWTALTEKTSVDLFREEVEFGGGVKHNALGDEQYLYMNIEHLATTLYDQYAYPDQSKHDFICDFVGLMNLLGNDFVPHGMGLKIRDEGVETLLKLYRQKMLPLVEQDANKTWVYNPFTLAKFMKELAEQEPRAMLRGIKKKLEARIGSTASKEPEQQAMARYNDMPAVWAAESVLVERKQQSDDEKPKLLLKYNWEDIYDKQALWGAKTEVAAEYYLQSLAWTLAYYSGAQVDTQWYYPWPLPPRMATVQALLETKEALHIPQTQHTPLKPLEQLAMVLPQTSFDLLPPEFAQLPKLYPHAWPTEWGVYSFGRRFLWECEPLIPLVQPAQMKTWIEMLYEE